MFRFILLVFLCVAHVSCYPRHEEEEARVLSEVWEAMDKHRGDDIIVIPRHDGPGSGPGSGPEHHSSDHRSSDHHEPSHGSSSHEGPSSDRSESERSNDTENTSESSAKSDSSSESSAVASESPERSSEESSRGRHGSDESSYDKIWSKFNRLGDMMNRAVDRLRKDDREIQELENGSASSSGGLTVFILEIVGAVVVGLILVGLLVFGFVKGLKGLTAWKARRQSERLVDQEAPNMDGTGYQSGYNP